MTGNDSEPMANGYDRTRRAGGQDGVADSAPARTSSLIAFGIAIAMICMFAWQIPATIGPALIGALGALSLTSALWLVDADDDTVSYVLASLLSLPVALGFVGSASVMAILLVSEIFPVETPALLSLGSLVLISYVGVVVGSSLAILGVSLGYRNVAETRTLRRYTNVTFVTGIVPSTIGIMFAIGAIYLQQGGPMGLLSAGMGIVTNVVLTGDPVHLNLGTFLFVLTAATGSLWIAANVLPFRELLAADSTGEGGSVERTIEVLFLATLLTGLAAILVTMVEIGVSADAIEASIGSALFDTIRLVTNSSLLRVLLFVIALTALTATAIGYAVRRIARVESAKLRRRLTALASGTLVTVVAISLSEPIYDRLVEEIGRRLPGLITAQFVEHAARVATTYGEATIIVILTGFLMGITGMALLGLRLALFLGYLSSETTGFSLASIGLFLGTIFAGTIGAPAWFVFAGIAASFVVWDAGEFGATLGYEIGRRNGTRSLEYVHAGGTALVGLVGVGLALGVTKLFDRGLAVASPTTVLALCSLLVGMVALIEALR